MTFLFDHPVLLFVIAFAVLTVVTQAGFRIRQGYPVSEYIARMFPHTLVLVGALTSTTAFT